MWPFQSVGALWVNYRAAVAPDFDQLRQGHRQKLQRTKPIVGIIGMGYVGLPLAIAFAEAGAKVLGFDLDPSKAKEINAGRSYIGHIAFERIAKQRQAARMEGTADMARLDEPDAILVCVPTPLSAHLEPNLSFIESSARSIAARLRRDQLVVLESTTYPGTTRDVMKPILEASGLRAGEDFFLAYSPEREDPGNLEFSTSRIPKVVGADDAHSLARAVALYELMVPKVIPVSSAGTAEAVKITENVFRAINIALVNELKVIYQAMGIDVWEVIDAAKSKPFGFMPFYPGPGLGGHCIPIDPFYLTWKAREYNQYTKLIELAGQINAAMPDYVIDVLAKSLDARQRKGVNGSRILLMGLAYKKNVEDIRESPAFKLIEGLEHRGATVDFYDPYVAVVPNTREHPALAGRKSQPWDLKKFGAYDAVLICTDHDNVDYVELAKSARLVVDSRNACARAKADLTNVVPA
jgi:UDP-N-acetyl-D-glucosamine dehydrogenase